MRDIRNVRKSGNSFTITMPSWYRKKVLVETGKKITAFSYEVGKNNELKLKPIFESEEN
jgi:antitoxin component of MazEF toxin-antitoxin module